MRPILSVIIIACNEALNIRECLESVSWADEIIVVDSGSTDDTLEICREFTAHVYSHDWPGFGKQKNRALNYARKDWIFSIDADERVTPELRAQMEQAMNEAQYDGYFMPRYSQFCGAFIRHCGWYPDYVLRLFRRGKGRFSEDLVHESVIVDGATGKLSCPLLHYSYRNKEDVTRKVQHYSDSAAQQMFAAGKKTNWLDAPLRGGWAFLRTWLLRLGVLDGRAGLAIAWMNARTTYLKYCKLAELRSSKAR
jgi:glycosyltransferase involved in cell wall biosynthesis